jgi:hypothetical protein
LIDLERRNPLEPAYKRELAHTYRKEKVRFEEASVWRRFLRLKLNCVDRLEAAVFLALYYEHRQNLSSAIGAWKTAAFLEVEVIKSGLKTARMVKFWLKEARISSSDCTVRMMLSRVMERAGEPKENIEKWSWLLDISTGSVNALTQEEELACEICADVNVATKQSWFSLEEHLGRSAVIFGYPQPS